MNLKRLAVCAAFTASAAVQAQNALDFPQPDNLPDEFYAVTDIPAGGTIKYETDAKTGFIVADRFQSMPVAWPANYGSLTQSLGGDNDPLDGGEVDDKIVAVPTSKIDPAWDDIKSMSDLPKIEQERLQAFFRVYKQLPDGRKKVELHGFESAALLSAIRRY